MVPLPPLAPSTMAPCGFGDRHVSMSAAAPHLVGNDAAGARVATVFDLVRVVFVVRPRRASVSPGRVLFGAAERLVERVVASSPAFGSGEEVVEVFVCRLPLTL